MTAPPIAPRLVRGGIVLIDPTNGTIQRVITLQYNPDSVTRTLQIKGAGSDSGDHLEVLRLKGPPAETVKVDVELDATDQLEAGDPQALADGIHPQLAALETIVYPSSLQLEANNQAASSGTLEIAPMEMSLSLFVFGSRRVLPVRLTEFSITEEAFDVNLNPIRAKVSLTMRVLTVDDFGFDNKGGNLYLVYQKQKEQWAGSKAGGNITGLGLNSIP